jgi:hypothetical protein
MGNRRAVRAPYEDGRSYTARFDGYIAHAEKHVLDAAEAWSELLAEATPESYREYAFGALDHCLGLPRYLHARETSVENRPGARTKQALSSGLLDGVILVVRSIVTREMLYAGHDSGVIITARLEHGNRLMILTAYRCGDVGDDQYRRQLEMKKKVLRMTQKGKHSHRTLQNVRWYTVETWSARHRKVSA